jgi:dTDP-4-dehydrorhamnose reductase
MRPLIVGTGFLGRSVVNNFKQRYAKVVHTYHSHKYFDDSCQFNLFSQRLGDVVALSDIDLIIVTSKIEGSHDTKAVIEAMQRLFESCKNKRVIYISTDAVFDGRKGRYSEIDAPKPVTVYGKQKNFCEDILRELVPNYCIVRPSYIYGYSLGQLDDRLQNAIEVLRVGHNLYKFDNMFKSPVEVNQLADIIENVSLSDFKGVLHAGGARMSVYEFFKQLLAVLGNESGSLLRDHIPESPAPECLVDTSLDSKLLRDLFEFEPVTLEDALIKSADRALPDIRNPAQSIGNRI